MSTESIDSNCERRCAPEMKTELIQLIQNSQILNNYRLQHKVLIGILKDFTYKSVLFYIYACMSVVQVQSFELSPAALAAGGWWQPGAEVAGVVASYLSITIVALAIDTAGLS